MRFNYMYVMELRRLPSCVALVLFLLFSCPTGVWSCPPANIPSFEDTSRTELPGPVQALVLDYTFSCYGNVTMWGACVQPGGDPDTQRYYIWFQVYRPTPEGAEGCYDFVGQNYLENGIPIDRCVVLEDIPPEEQISVEPGDVVGFYSAEHENEGKVSDGGVQLDTDRMDVTVWYNSGPMMDIGGSSCQLRVGDEESLNMQTNRPPVITAQVLTITTSASTPTPTPSPSASPSPSPTPTHSSPSSSFPSLQLLIPPLPQTTTLSSRLASEPISEPSDGESPVALFAGIAAGVAFSLGAAMAVLVVVVIVVRKRRKYESQTPEVHVNTSYGVAAHAHPVKANPAYGAFKVTRDDDRDHKSPFCQPEGSEYEMVDDREYDVPDGDDPQYDVPDGDDPEYDVPDGDDPQYDVPDGELMSTTNLNQTDLEYSYPRTATNWPLPSTDRAHHLD